MMKKDFFCMMTVMLVAMMSVSVMSCGGDSVDGPGISGQELKNQAIGTWMCTQSTDEAQGNTYNGLMVGKQVTIYDNGTYTSTASSFGYTGTYSISGNTITAKSNQGTTFVISVSIRGNNMTWQGTTSNGVTFNYVFMKESDNTPTTQNITKEMIAGDFSWQVEEYTVQRGSSGSKLYKGATVHFNTDGSCTGFHSMENAYRINNGRIETYYQKTNEPMFVYTLLSQSGETVRVQMDGTLDDDLQAILTLKKVADKTPETQTTTDESWLSKDAVQAVFSACYQYLSEFEDAQQKLEKQRCSGNAINSQNTNLKNAWEAAYQSINVANMFIERSSNVQNFGGTLTSDEIKRMQSELRGVRAFVYYNIAMLWGDVPLIEVPNITDWAIPHHKQEEVFSFAYTEISQVLTDLADYNDVNDRLHMRKDAGTILKAELEMTLGNQMAALSLINKIDKQLYGDNKHSIWLVSKTDNATGSVSMIPVYTADHLNLYSLEASGDKAEALTSWKNTSVGYGYWAALKRMQQAQTVTGCANYELLMPFPYTYIATNPSATQNPGY